MRQLRILPINATATEPAFYLLQELESHKYFSWRQETEEKAQATLETLTTAWEKDALEKPRDLFVNFVDRIDRTLFQRRE